MKFSQLEYFCAICRYKSISKAATMLFVSPPTISIAIRELEKELGVTLFFRAKNQMLLTQEGALFETGAKDLLQREKKLIQQVRSHSVQGRNFKIGLPPVLSTVLLLPLTNILNQMQTNFPHCTFQISEFRTDELIAALESGSIDWAICLLDNEAAKSQTCYFIFETPLKLFMSISNPLACNTVLTFEQLRNEPLISCESNSVVVRAVESWYHSYGCKPNFSFQISQRSTICALLESNLGSHFSPWELDEKNEEIVGLSLADPITISIGIIGNQQDKPSHLSVKILEQLKNIYPFQK